MEASVVKAKLIEVLESIQLTSGLECPVISGDTKPLDALPKFDSKVWPIAICLLSEEIGMPIADDVNIFRTDESCVALTIDETVALIVEMSRNNEVPLNQAVNSQ